MQRSGRVRVESSTTTLVPLFMSEILPRFTQEDLFCVTNAVTVAEVYNGRDFKKLGGYFALYSIADESLVLASVIGTAQRIKNPKRCLDTAIRQCEYLSIYPKGGPFHLGSQRTKQPHLQGASFRTKHYILSLAGFPPDVSEAVLIFVASNLGWLSFGAAADMFRHNKNQLVKKMFNIKD